MRSVIALLLNTIWPAPLAGKGGLRRKAKQVTVQIELVYATRERQRVASYAVNPGACVADVLQLAAADPLFEDLDLRAYTMGVFGKPCQPSTVLKDGDRVELYRELELDAKTARHLRAKQQQESADNRRG